MSRPFDTWMDDGRKTEVIFSNHEAMSRIENPGGGGWK